MHNIVIPVTVQHSNKAKRRISLQHRTIASWYSDVINKSSPTKLMSNMKHYISLPSISRSSCYLDQTQWRSNRARGGGGGGLPRVACQGGGILDKPYVIFFLIILNNHYYAISLNRKSSYCVAQCPGTTLWKWACHLIYASIYSSEYNRPKDLILMFIMSHLHTVFLRLCII